MDQNPFTPLRVLVTDGIGHRLDEVTRELSALGHEVVAKRVSLDSVGQVTAVERPDVALVIVGEATEQALQMIDRIVREATCPVIALLDVQDRAFVKEAARRGIFAYITGEEAEELQSSMDIVLRRFAEYHNLEGAFARRALTERAKGILMERHGVDEREAFEMLRRRARETQRKLVAIAEVVVTGLTLLPATQKPGSSREDTGDHPDVS